MNLIINILVAVVVFWVIYSYLLPMLPAPIHAIALIIFVLAVIVYLLRLLA